MRIFEGKETPLAASVRRSVRPLHLRHGAGDIVQMAVLGGIVLCLLLFAGMLLLLEVGFRLGVRFEKARGGEAASIFDSAIFALLGLLLGFAFAGAVDRLDKRRDLIVAEANDISTAYLRIDTLAPEDQPAIRELFRQYLEARLRVYRVIDAEQDPTTAFASAEALQAEIWSAAVSAVDRPSRQYTAEIVLPAINEMIDVTTERKVVLSTHIPELVLVLLFGVSLFSALLAGAGASRHGIRHIVHGSIFAAAVTLTVYTILDLDSPRGGLIRLDAADRVLEQLRSSIDPG